MNKDVRKSNELRRKRKLRVRKKIFGTAERPRLSVFRSATHLYAQVIDDTNGVTLVSISSMEKGNHRRANVKVCNELGKVLSERCLSKKITKITFDKNGNMYHGRVKSFADGAREGGLVF